jgi:hypothetical protein
MMILDYNVFSQFLNIEEWKGAFWGVGHKSSSILHILYIKATVSVYLSGVYLCG